jgi:hypothetical protein
VCDRADCYLCSLIANLFIIAGSSALLVYWFRYTCALILQREHSADYALKVASTIRLNFPQTEKALQADPRPPALDRLHECLENDYRILTGLLREASAGNSIERRILTIDYQMMRAWFKLTRRSDASSQARNALAEMSSILGYFAAEIAQTGAI